MTDRTIILDALIRVAVLFITAVLAPAVKAWIDRNAENREMQLVLQMADIAVKSVENDLKTETGLKKKTEAIARLADQINGWGLKGFTSEELNHYIETAVKEMWVQELPEAVPIVIDAPDPGMLNSCDIIVKTLKEPSERSGALRVFGGIIRVCQYPCLRLVR